MSNLPEVTFNILDGKLGQLGALTAKNQVKLGVCSDGIPGTLYGFGDLASMQATLGQGPLMDACAQVLGVAGAPIYAIPIAPTVAGTASGVTHAGTGAGTVAVTFAPRVPIRLKIQVGGANGTMTFSVSLNGGSYSTPVATIAGAFPYAVPGTETTVTFASGQTWVLGDIYTVNTDGTVVLTGTGPAASNVTQVSSPLDVYSAVVTVNTAGAPGVGIFTLSLDGGNTNGAPTLIPSGGKYVAANTGLVLTFASAFVVGDTYSFTTTTAGYTTGDLGTMIQTLVASTLAFETIHVVGAAATAAGAAAVAAVVDAQMSAAEAQFRFAGAIIECPQGEGDAAMVAAFASFRSLRVGVGGGDLDLASPIAPFRIERRNVAWAASARMAQIPVGESAGYVGRGPLKNVRSLYRDEFKTPLLDQAGFLTARTFAGESGFFVTRDRIMAPDGSDFDRFNKRRPMDKACAIARKSELPYVNGPFRVDSAGHITEADAKAFEARLTGELKAGLSGDVSDVSCSVDRTANVLSTRELPVTISIVPLFTAETISTRIGYSNPALIAA